MQQLISSLWWWLLKYTLVIVNWLTLNPLLDLFQLHSTIRYTEYNKCPYQQSLSAERKNSKDQFYKKDFLQNNNWEHKSPYLLKPGTSQNVTKPAETTRNDTKVQNWGNLEFSTSFYFSNFEPICPNLSILDQKVSTF